MSEPVLGIIGGTGLTNLSSLEVSRRQVVRTPYGEPSGALTFGEIRGLPVVFLARHGYGHTIVPHQVNYRANLWAMHSVGVRKVVSVASVGGIAPELGPGVLAVPHQIIDYTWGRKSTFFEGPDQPVTHIDFTHCRDRPPRARRGDDGGHDRHAGGRARARTRRAVRGHRSGGEPCGRPG